MNIFDELAQMYFEINGMYSNAEIRARAKGHYLKEAEYARKRELNDHAYFLFMFTRLENRIRELSNNLIDSKHSSLTKWEYKRTWDILHKKKTNNPDNIHFLDRVALLTKLGNSDYNLVKRYYDQRNNIAHGNTFTIAITLSIVLTDMKRLYNSLN